MKPTSNPSAFGFVFAAILFIIGGVFTFLGTTFGQQQAATQGWPTVPGTVVETYVHVD